MSRKLAAEFLGTLWLVLGGCGAAVLAAKFPEVGIGLLGVSLAFGLTVLSMAYEPPRLCRRPFGLGHAASAISSRAAW
jgi:glycerol uptake facilitator-like aquaporin